MNHFYNVDAVSANQTDGLGLWDIRRPLQKVLAYGSVDRKCRGAMSAVFNESGTRIMALGRRQSVILYSIDSPLQLFEFNHPGAYPTKSFKYWYANICNSYFCIFLIFNQYILLGQAFSQTF
jgi:hypothetical protein